MQLRMGPGSYIPRLGREQRMQDPARGSPTSRMAGTKPHAEESRPTPRSKHQRSACWTRARNIAPGSTLALAQ